MRLEDSGAVEGGAQVRARGVETFRRAEDESRGTVGRVRCVLCLCSTRSERLGGGDLGRWRIGGRK